MNPGELRDAVAREVRHGRQALAAARALQALAMFNDALARIYYAAFHLATSVLLTEGVEPRRHRAMPGLLMTHLAGAGFDATDAACLARLATYRDMADYERAFDASEALLGDALRDAELFVEKALACLRERGFLTPEVAPLP